jgi:hypothetical protein
LVPKHFIDTALLWVLIAVHCVLCLIAAGYSGYRLFAAEHFRSTLDSVLLLPLSARQWLGLKLVFPILAVLVAWVTALPFYLVAALCNLIRFDDLAYMTHKPLLGGVTLLAAALMVTPDYLKRSRQASAKQGVPFQQMDLDLHLRGMLLMWVLYALGVGLIYGGGLCAIPRPFYDVFVPEAFFWVGGGAAFIPAATLTAMCAVVTSDKRERFAAMARMLALIALYYTGLGLYWRVMPDWQKLGFAIGLPIITVFMNRNKGSRREDTGMMREIQWISQRWDNPMLLRDLRVYGRFFSIRSCMMWSCAASLLGVIALVGVGIKWGFGNAMVVFSWIACQIAIQGAAMTWAKPKLLWHKEWTQQTLPLLLLTPLRSEEILLGRLMAVPIYFWTGKFPLVISLVAALVWMATQGYWIALPAALAASPLLLSMGIWSCCRVARVSPLSRSVLVGDAKTILLRILQGIALCAGIVLVGAAFSSSLGVAFVLTPLVGWGCGILLGISNAYLAWAWFRLRVQQLDTFRQKDIEESDNSVMRQQAPD